MTGFVDIHSHFVYGMDDGARTREEMYAMLDAAHEDGITNLYATPHVTPGIHRFDELLFYKHLEEARDYCLLRNYPIAIHAGAELLYTPAMQSYILRGELPTLGKTELLLVEFSPDIDYRELAEAVALMAQGGYTPVLAHFERYRCLYKRGRLKILRKKYPVLCQLNANTLIDPPGFFRRRVIDGWLKAGIVDFVSSDAHGVEYRPFCMSRARLALEEKYDPEQFYVLMAQENSLIIV